MSDSPSKCWKVQGVDVETGKGRAITYFCAQPNTFSLSFTFYVRNSQTVVKAVRVIFQNENGNFTGFLDTNVLSDGSEEFADSANSYQTSDDFNIYLIQGNCSGCGCDTRTHCRVPCPNTALGYCCLPKDRLKFLAHLVREVSGNRT